MGHARVTGRSGSYIRPAAPTGPAPAAAGGQVQCQTPDRVSHSQSHARCYQLQPGIITEPPGSLTVILKVIPPGPTAANQTALNGMPSQPELPRPD
jgi:hypothetical protein